MANSKSSLSVLGFAISVAVGSVSWSVSAVEPMLSKVDFEIAKSQYFQRCAGCHGILRKGKIGKNLEPKVPCKKVTSV